MAVEVQGDVAEEAMVEGAVAVGEEEVDSSRTQNKGLHACHPYSIFPLVPMSTDALNSPIRYLGFVVSRSAGMAQLYPCIVQLAVSLTISRKTLLLVENLALTD